MDWSLVLVSQGIETMILPPGEGGKWSLVVASQDCERALKALRQYKVENRDWPWQRTLPWTRTHFDWVCLMWAGLLMAIHWLSDWLPNLHSVGIMDSAKTLSGQWWRVFTAMTLHADLGHLATNLSIGIVLLGLAMGVYGTGTGLLAALLAGAVGNLASLWLNAKPFQGLGASGMVMGALGLLAAQSLLPGARERQSLKFILGGVVAGVMMFVLFGLTPGTDIAAHLGGFVMGLILGVGLGQAPEGWVRNRKVNFLCGLIFVLIVAGTWWMAVRN